MKPTPFYIIWSPEGKTPPKEVIGTRWRAEQVKNTMAAKYPNQTFYVMKSKSEARTTVITTQSFSSRQHGKWRSRKDARKEKEQPTHCTRFGCVTCAMHRAMANL